jgi:hypothetical protein
MKLTSIRARGWLGLSDLSLQCDKPFLAVTGPNGAGKTSLVESIRFALLGELPRGVKLARERVMLVSEGTGKTGRVEVTLDGDRLFNRDIATLELSGGARLEDAEAAMLPYVLEASSFAKLDPAKRRTFLSGLMGVRVSKEAVEAELLEEGLPTDVVEEILPIVLRGFPAAADYAKERASQERGAWKTVAGEAYGSNKAEGWTAAVLGEENKLGEEELRALVSKHTEAETLLLEAQGKLAVAKSERAKADRAATARGLVRSAEEIEIDLAKAQAELELTQDAAAALKQAASAPSGTTGPCPCCGVLLTLDRGAFIENKGSAPAGPDTQAALAKANGDVRALRDKVDTLQRDLALAKTDAYATEWTPELIERQGVIVSNLQLTFDQLAARLLAAKTAEGAEAAAAHRTTTARAHHQAVLAWAKAHDLLQPEGIPARFVAKVIGPINRLLLEAAATTRWPQVAITPGLEVMLGTRAYAMACESEQWRADAMLAAAVARLSGLRLLVLDRFDVLEPSARGVFWDWLLGMSSEFDTVIAAGTLKSAPVFDPTDPVQVLWLGNNQE